MTLIELLREDEVARELVNRNMVITADVDTRLHFGCPRCGTKANYFEHRVECGCGLTVRDLRMELGLLVPALDPASLKVIKFSETGFRVGESHQRAKFTDAQIEEMRTLRDAGVPLVQIAEKLNVSVSYVSRVSRYDRRNVTVARIIAIRRKEVTP